MMQVVCPGCGSDCPYKYCAERIREDSSVEFQAQWKAHQRRNGTRVMRVPIAEDCARRLESIARRLRRAQPTAKVLDAYDFRNELGILEARLASLEAGKPSIL